jgi:hypothetical protein
MKHNQSYANIAIRPAVKFRLVEQVVSAIDRAPLLEDWRRTSSNAKASSAPRQIREDPPLQMSRDLAATA